MLREIPIKPAPDDGTDYFEGENLDSTDPKFGKEVTPGSMEKNGGVTFTHDHEPHSGTRRVLDAVDARRPRKTND